MKKVLFLLVTILLSFSNIVSANNSYEVIYSDITVCINHYNIPSFAVNGTSVVSVEDLSKYGMSVENKSGFFRISVVEYRTIDPVQYEIDINQLGSTAGYAKKNVTPVYVNNQQISSYNLNGYTLVPVEELNILGDVCWVPEQKALKLWIDGLHVKPIFEPPVINAESSLYRETVEIVNAYRAVNDFEQAVSALDWTISHLSENSSIILY